ncbi:hypothetical protein SUGI_0697470 [Cryptomeria japonica]|nr:hypothetical protein SUGI_0697470 [Cryptomeria japonica]
MKSDGGRARACVSSQESVLDEDEHEDVDEVAAASPTKFLAFCLWLRAFSHVPLIWLAKVFGADGGLLRSGRREGSWGSDGGSSVSGVGKVDLEGVMDIVVFPMLAEAVV